MARADKEKWNKKYKNNPIPNEPIKLIRDHINFAKVGKALDIACGMGRHSQYLASLGFEVKALDISSVAIAALRGNPSITAMEVDFDTYQLDETTYDLIICSYFLERKLFPQMIKALKPNGLVMIETFMYDNDNEKEPSNPSFLLKKGELKSYFEKDCEIITIKQWWDKDYAGAKVMKVSMVAKKKP